MSLTLHKYSQDILCIGINKYHYYSLSKIAQRVGKIDNLPKTMKILLENLIRSQNNNHNIEQDIQALIDWQKNAHSNHEISFYPTRILMQDFTGVPALVDLAAMRDAVSNLNGDVMKVNPLLPVDLIIDHSVTVDYFGNKEALIKNIQIEMERNHERYLFLRWGQKSFNHFRVVPPGTGICHQVNLEYLSKVICIENSDNKTISYPETVLGTDSHTTMINALGMLGWGVGGIEAEAAMLGQPIVMVIPDVVGVKLVGKLLPGITATDLVLTITEMLRKQIVVGKFVEFYGEGLKNLSLADRATIANMAPEYGATCGFFPIDDITLKYMMLCGHQKEQIDLVEIYAKQQGLWHNSNDEQPVFTNILELDMTTVEASIAGPKRPQERVSLRNVPFIFNNSTKLQLQSTQIQKQIISNNNCKINSIYRLENGSVVIAAITSCTNTSNPNVLITAGLLAKKATELGLRCKPWVKTSLAPGSKVVSHYLNVTGLSYYFDILGFNLVGYGCTTCIGNTGPLIDNVENEIKNSHLIVAAVLSGNRNFEGRIHPLVKTNWLASPPLVIAYALAGNIRINLQTDPIAQNQQGKNIFLKDIWPSANEISEILQKINSKMFTQEYAAVFEGPLSWKQLKIQKTTNYNWDQKSTYIRPSPFFDKITKIQKPLKNIKLARILAIYGDSLTTDHISPAGNIKIDSPAGKYLLSNGVTADNFNSYGARRGNHEVMVRGTFSNIRIHNEIVPGIEGGYTKHFPSNEILTIYDASMRYQKEGISLAIITGKEYGSGSSRDWAAKGPKLLGIQLIIAESFERIHRSNLIGMGILPLEFPKNITRKTLKLTGEEYIEVKNLSQIQPKSTVEVIITFSNGKQNKLNARCRIDTASELTYYQNNGILNYILRNMIK
ncbi:aconitate hydratase AcnA [Pantoea sp. Mhis]|uniref:aconitate hydratase AcnA n=1 Tax=Pantoea sp. Mhis TaxID=2576759 RepID=UPI00135743D9|nr:aconitate hydratase AcnA [Pantoea sp. Mhis]MXP56193.1 aconitate hydratase AcnA [Pantoea sp. Mhis]